MPLNGTSGRLLADPAPVLTGTAMFMAAVGEADLRLVTRESRSGSSHVIEVDVFIGPVSDLRVYDLALEVQGAAAGEVRLQDIVIDMSRPDYIFAGLSTHFATNMWRASMLNVVPEIGVDVSDSAYLATFIYRTTANVDGAVRFSVRRNAETLLRTSIGEPIRVNPAATKVKLGR